MPLFVWFFFNWTAWFWVTIPKRVPDSKSSNHEVSIFNLSPSKCSFCFSGQFQTVNRILVWSFRVINKQNLVTIKPCGVASIPHDHIFQHLKFLSKLCRFSVAKAVQMFCASRPKHLIITFHDRFQKHVFLLFLNYNINQLLRYFWMFCFKMQSGNQPTLLAILGPSVVYVLYLNSDEASLMKTGLKNKSHETFHIRWRRWLHYWNTR